MARPPRQAASHQDKLYASPQPFDTGLYPGAPDGERRRQPPGVCGGERAPLFRPGGPGL
ncbi:protein of unknown function [Candidatus Methylocalor cossyra]|uniref:Uncharacterized protein n=1 Tax=Candidatus Methylocalor cossyra TaxID=3108543 RepID=A0ABP1C3P0_9GAMM